MVGELINRSVLLKDVHNCKMAVSACSNNDYMRGYASALSGVEKQIASMHTIDAEPVRHGRWNSVTVLKKYGGIVIQCSECGMKGTRIWNFCPNCGTKMDEGVEV